jgi:hypothetical protein
MTALSVGGDAHGETLRGQGTRTVTAERTNITPDWSPRADFVLVSVVFVNFNS